MQAFQLAGDKEKIILDGTIKQNIADTEAKYKQLLQTSAGAAQVYQQMMTNLANISTNKDMTEENKTTALNNGMKMMNDALDLLGKITDLNLGTTLTFSSATVDMSPTAVAARKATQDAADAAAKAAKDAEDARNNGGGGSGGDGT
jgi:hypothetical protein